MNGKLLGESLIKEEDFDLDALYNQDIKELPKMLGRIWRVPDKEFEGPKFLMSCPKCENVCSNLVGHIKRNHTDIDWRGIKTTCPYEDCQKVLVDIQNHIRHAHLKIKNYGCDLCDAKFPNRTQVKIHMNGVHSVVRKKCPQCDVLLKITSLKEHIRNAHTSVRKRVTCTEIDCKKNFASKSDMQRHVGSVHKTKHVLKSDFMVCEITNSRGEMCGKKLRNEVLLRHVERVHLRTKNEKKINCPECGIEICQESLQRHHKLVHPKGAHEIKTRVKCDKCDKEFRAKYQLRNHINKIHLKLRCTCPDCGAIVAASYLKDHQRFTHQMKMAAVCDLHGCDTTFRSNAAKIKHIKRVHEGIRETCPECDKQVSNLQFHIKIVHKKERPHSCQECNKTFQMRTHLRNHMKSFHLGLRVECKECGSMVTNVQSHTAFVHKKVRNFPCDQCETRCRTSTELKVHILSAHVGNRKHCEICDKDIAMSYLKKHMRSHNKTEEEKKPHTCKECEKAFTDPGTLKKHIQRTHQGITEKCPRCGLECKDLYRHMKYTKCESEMYVPRRKKTRKKDMRNHFFK